MNRGQVKITSFLKCMGCRKNAAESGEREREIKRVATPAYSLRGASWLHIKIKQASCGGLVFTLCCLPEAGC